jgi:pimeloyl-ACP methyl ester carboxylesterase
MKKIFFKLIGAGFNLVSFIFPALATRWAILLFSTPQRNPVREKEKAFLDAALQIRSVVGDLPIVEYHWGPQDGTIILLSYGWEYNAGRWRHFVPAMIAAGYRVIAYDPPGHGLAPNGQMNIPYNAAIIRYLIKKYGQPEVIIGHSFGGGSSVYALSELDRGLHPKRLVVMAAFSFAPRIFKEFAQALSIRPALYYRVVRAFEQRVGKRLEDFDFARMVAEMPHIRGLVVHSPGDTVTPYAEARRFYDLWDGAAIFSPATGGHHLGTAETTNVVLDFAIQGNLPEKVEIQKFPVAGKHDLVRYFAGM